MPTSDNNPSLPLHPSGTSDAVGASRRQFLLIGLGLVLTGCSTPSRVASTVPPPVWRPRSEPVPTPPRGEYIPEPMPAPVEARTAGILPRANWTSIRPLPTRMQRMTPVNYITVHHDGMSPFFDTDEANTKDRLERIRRYHRDHLHWGDIGYHYAIDRSGRVWECRPISYQGAHVGDHNEGNIGVLLLGSFDQQTPTDRQTDALNAHLSSLMRTYRLPVNRVMTHREWPSANTVCPGASLQRHMEIARRSGWIG